MNRNIILLVLLVTSNVHAELLKGVLKCDLGVFKVVGGEYIFDYGSKGGAVVVDQGNKFSISGSIFNDDSPVLSMKQVDGKRIDTAKTDDMDFQRIILKDNVLYDAVSAKYKLAIQADKCEPMK